MTLEKYKTKRSPKTTPEPFGEIKPKKKKSKELIFVIQKHAASHLHYDFRLEAEGVLKSWAIPKGPSLNPKDKRLAVMVEDHPYDYHNFEGVIPKGSYGGGTVMVWDTGTYVPLDEKGNESDEKCILSGLKKGKLVFILKGSKLSGRYSLVRIQSDSAKENWLLIKGNDEYASTVDILKKEKSVLTQKTMDELSDSNTLWKNKPEREKKKLIKKIDPLPKIYPMLAFLVNEAFDKNEWLFETKWDGFRAIAEVDNSQIDLYSRNFLSFNTRFKPIIEALEKLEVQAIFDGEIVVLNEKGKSSFQALQNYQRTGKGDLRYCIFDFLYFEGHDMRELPLIKRKELLEKIITNDKTSILLYSQHTKKFGKKAFTAAEEKGEEGIIAKNGQSLYIEGRSRDWLKIKTHACQEAVICGYTEPRGSRKKFGALIIGVYREGKLQYAGHVGGGFTEDMLSEVSKKIVPLITKKCPFEEIPPTNSPVTWIKPKLVCEVSFHEWTSDNRMRQPIFKGFRVDKEAKEVKRENAISLETSEKKITKTASNEPPLTNLDKVFWPEEGYTKGMLLDYYREVSEFILPYLKDRPQSLRRYPHGISAEGFFQKNINSTFPDWLKTIPVKHKDGVHNYLLIPDKKTLLYVVNLGCIDLNPFSSRIKNLDNPDYIIFDLDPEDIPFEAVMEVAKVLYKTLKKYDIESYCKTSGSRGLHVLVPAGAKYSYEQVKLFAELICTLVHEQLPDITSMERSPAKRQKKVYLDFLQNNFGQTIAAPYSVRAKPHAPVSTPLEWNELKKGLLPSDFTIENILKRIKKKGDLFKPILGKGVNLSKILKEMNLHTS